MANPGTPPGAVSKGTAPRGKATPLLGAGRDVRVPPPLNPTPAKPPSLWAAEGSAPVLSAAWSNLIIYPSGGAVATNPPALSPERRAASHTDLTTLPSVAPNVRSQMNRRPSIGENRGSGMYSSPVSTGLLEALPSPSFEAPPPHPPAMASGERLGAKVTKLPPPPAPPKSPGRDSLGSSQSSISSSPGQYGSPPNRPTSPALGSSPMTPTSPVIPPFPSSSMSQLPLSSSGPVIPPFSSATMAMLHASPSSGSLPSGSPAPASPSLASMPSSTPPNVPPLSLSASHSGPIIPPISPRPFPDRNGLSSSGIPSTGEGPLLLSAKRNKRMGTAGSEAAGDHRKFKVQSYGGEYFGPKITAPPLPNSLDPPVAPYYIDNSGSAYDRNYLPLPAGRNPVVVAERLLQRMPVPTDFTNFFAYEEALVSWRTEAEEAMRGIQLPQPMGQHYSRPRLPQSSGTGSASLEIKSMDMPQEESGSTPEGLSVSEKPIVVEFTEHRLNTDPWHAVLVPAEPQPELFNTFEDYETALLRWAALCSGTLPVIPPHPTQLPSLLPMRAILEDKKQTQTRKVVVGAESDRGKENIRKHSSALPPVSFLPTLDIARLRWYPGEGSDRLSRHDDQLALRKDTQVALQKLLGGLAARLQQNKDKLTCPNLPVLPSVHGSFPLSNRSTVALPPRRPGLTETEQRLSLDCPSEIDGKRVEFRLPEHDVDVNWSQLFSKNAEEYKFNVRQQLTEQNQKHRLDTLYSWYHPKTPAATLQQQRSELLTFFMGSSTNWSDLFCRNQAFLDKFQDFLVSRPYDDEESPNVISVLTKRLDLQQFLSILDLVPAANSMLVHAKISAFLFEAFQDMKMKNFVDVLVSGGDLQHLSVLVYTLCITCKSPVDVFPYNEDHMLLLKRVVIEHTGFVTFARSIFTLYYLNCAEKPLSQGVFLGINSFVQEQRRTVLAQIDAQLQKSSAMFSALLTKGVGNRSVSVAQLSAFLCLQLINNHDPIVQKYLRPPQLKLPQLLRTVGQSRFSHVQHLTRVLYSRMQTEFWFSVMLGSLTIEFIKEDLLRPCGNNSPHTLTRIMIDVALPLFRNNTPQSLSLVCPCFLDDRLFNELLAEFNDSEKSGYKPQHETLGEFLWELISMWTRGAAVTVSADKAAKRLGSTSASRSNLFGLTILVQDLRNLMLLTESRKLRENENPLIYRNKTWALRILSRLVELPEVFTFTRSLVGDQALFTKMLASCRDPNGDYNKAAYQLFFKVIRFHSNVVDSLEAIGKGNVLQGFLEVAGPSLPNAVVCNSLHYLAKLFSIEVLEQRRVTAGKPPKRHGEQMNLKTIKDDLKTLTKFFLAKRLFIKVHIIYMRLNTNPFSYPGLLFAELANFFWVVCNVAACKKLFRDLQGHSEYRDKLAKIYTMYSPPTQQREMKKIMSGAGIGT